MEKLIDRIWMMPLILVLIVIFAFLSISLRLFPFPYYISLVIPYLMVGNAVLLVYVIASQRQQLLKTLVTTLVALSLAYLWLIQTA